MHFHNLRIGIICVQFIAIFHRTNQIIMENSLKWTEDDRSIGFCDPDDSKAYTAIIGWNFDIVR